MTTLHIGGYAPAESTHGRAMAHFAGLVDAEVEILWNVMDLGRPASDLFQMAESGELTWCYFSTSYLADRVPELDVLDRPFVFEDLAEAHAALDGDLGIRLTEAVEARTGLTVLGFWDNGFRHLTNRHHPIRRPEDLAGMRVRLQPNATHERMVEAWGGIPVAVELSEAIRLISSGEVDAQENPLANTVAYGVEQVHRYVTMSAHLYGARAIFAGKATMAGLPPDLAAEVRAAARQAVIFQREAAAAYEAELRDRLEGEGLEFVDLTRDERVAFSAPVAHLREDTP